MSLRDLEILAISPPFFLLSLGSNLVIMGIAGDPVEGGGFLLRCC